MLKTVKVKFPELLTKSDGQFNLSDVCPHCKHSIQPIVIYGRAENIAKENTRNRVAIMLQCPFEKCNQFFIDWFSIVVGKWNIIKTTERLVYSYSPILENDLPKVVNSKFPDFTKIYNQAIQAEEYGLDQIAGIGYRKSIEFLIKNYAIHLDPDKTDHIKQTLLGKVISNYLGDFPKLQSLAKAVTWIGNDETHFVRKHEDKDIESMKKFIKSAATFISADLDAAEAMEFISAE